MSIRMTKWRIFAVLVSAVLLLDQVSKAWVLATFDLYASVPLIPPVLYLTRSENTGAAFGIGSGASEVFFLLALVITGVILVFFRQTSPTAYRQHVGLSLIVGAALGNALDRWQHGVVVDFVHIIIPNVISNVSNFADHAITIGVIILLYDSFRGDTPPQPSPLRGEGENPLSAQPQATEVQREGEG